MILGNYNFQCFLQNVMEDKDAIAIGIGSAIAGIAVATSWFISQPIIGTIIGVVVGAFISTYSATRTKACLEEREFMLKAIEVVYGPLYNAITLMERSYDQMLQYRYFTEYSAQIWLEIRDTYRYHMLDDTLRLHRVIL